jgi:ribosome-associated heat shock protein Hsp15
MKPPESVRIDKWLWAVRIRTMKVLALLAQRVGAQAVPQFAEDLTPPTEYQKPKEPVLAPLFSRPKGAGRPTKKDRREWDRVGKMF